MYCVLARSSRSCVGAAGGGGGGGAWTAGSAVVMNDSADGFADDGAPKSVSGIVKAGFAAGGAIISRNCAAETATVVSDDSSATGGDGRAGGGVGRGAGAGCGAGAAARCGAVTDSASFKLGDGVFLRLAAVSMSSPVVKTSSSSDAASSFAVSASTAST